MKDDPLANLEQGYDAALELIEKIDRLSQFQERISITDSFETIWQVLLAEIRRLVRIDVCALFAVDEASHDFVLRKISDSDRRDLCDRELEMQIECGTFSWVINRRQPSLLPSLALGESKTNILLPLSTVRKTLGAVLVMTSQDPSAITRETVKLLTMLARQCSLVLENVFLYDRLLREHDHLQRAQAQIVQAEKLASIGRLASGASHEILNPLNIVTGNIQLLLMGSDLSDQTVRRLTLMREQCRRITRIVKGLMRFSEESDSTKGMVSLNEEIRKVVALIEHELKYAGIRLQLDLGTGLPSLYGDREAILQMVLSLVNNAREAMPRGGDLEISSRLLEGADGGADGRSFIEITIRDTGEGIPAEYQQKIFEPFFTARAGEDGAGLGLYLSYCVAQGHGGRIRVESAQDEGTSMKVVFPVRQAE